MSNEEEMFLRYSSFCSGGIPAETKTLFPTFSISTPYMEIKMHSAKTNEMSPSFLCKPGLSVYMSTDCANSKSSQNDIVAA